MGGRKPKPAGLHVIEGTRIRSYTRNNDPGPEFTKAQELPPPPRHLRAPGKKLWNDLGRELLSSGVLQVVDIYALEQLASTWDRYQRLIEEGRDISPRLDATLRAQFAEFGATPSSRRRVSSNGSQGKAANRFQKFKSA